MLYAVMGLVPVKQFLRQWSPIRRIFREYFWEHFFFKIFFLMWTILKVFIEFAAILFLFYVLVFWPQGMWDLGLPIRNQTRVPALDGEVLTTGPLGKCLGTSSGKEVKDAGLGRGRVWAWGGGPDGVLIMASVNPSERLWGWDCSPELSWVGARALAFPHLQWQVPRCGKGAWPWGRQMTSVPVRSSECSHKYSDFLLLEMW